MTLAFLKYQGHCSDNWVIIRDHKAGALLNIFWMEVVSVACRRDGLMLLNYGGSKSENGHVSFNFDKK